MDFIFIHIPKTGGSSVKKSLCGIDTFGHCKAVDLFKQDMEVWSNSFKFAFIRNPWDRLVSAFYFAKMEKSYWHDNISKKKDGHPDYETVKNMSFSNFIEDICSDRRKYKHVSFRNQRDFICDRSGRCLVDFVGRFETLESDFSYICGKLNRPKLVLQRINVTSNRCANYQEHYKSKKEIEMVADLYREDLDIFNYEF